MALGWRYWLMADVRHRGWRRALVAFAWDLWVGCVNGVLYSRPLLWRARDTRWLNWLSYTLTGTSMACEACVHKVIPEPGDYDGGTQLCPRHGPMMARRKDGHA